MSDQIIRLSAEETVGIFNRHFGLRFCVFSVKDDDEKHIGFCARIGGLNEGDDAKHRAAAVWNEQYSFRVFAGVGDVILTFMDVLMEQQGK